MSAGERPYLDTLGVWAATAALPELIGPVLDQVAAAAPSLLDGAPALTNVGVIGVGASATVAGALAACLAESGRVPAWTVPGPEVPAFMGPGSLVLAVSTSGRSMATLAAAGTARDRGATVVVLSPEQGELAAFARAAGVPLQPLAIPGATGRVPMVSALTAALALLSDLDLLRDAQPALRAAVPGLQRRRDACLGPDGVAAVMARHIGRTIPLVYGAAGLPAVAAAHWKLQCNERVKTPAFCGSLPEVAHGEVSGWGQHGDVTRQVLTLIPLRQHGEPALVAQAFERAIEAMDEVVADVLAVWAEGDSSLARFLDLVLLGDFVCLHLAGREGIDPGPLAFGPTGG